MIPKMDIALNDFSGGELNPDAKRMDKAALTGARVMSNWRILNSKKLKNRPGRRALFLETGRVDKVLMTPGNRFFIAFGAGTLRVYSIAGAQLFNQSGFAWAINTVNSVVWCQDQSQKAIYIFFAGQQPQVLTWDGASTWSAAPYAETIASGGQKRTPFYRISPPSITLKPSNTSGNITVDFSAPIAVAGMDGTRIRYCGRQIILGSLVSSTRMNATVAEPLPPSQTISISGLVGAINLGDEVIGSTSNAKGIVTSTPTSQALTFAPIISSSTFQVGDTVTGGTSGATGVVTSSWFPWGSVGNFTLYVTVNLNTPTAFVSGEVIAGPNGSSANASASSSGYIVQLLPSGGTVNVFTTSDKMVGPSGSAQVSGVSTGAPQAVGVWDEEVMNSFRGWPASGFFDQGRLGMCNFPSVPSGISWSGFGLPADLYVDGTTAAGMFELAPNKSQVLHVVPGPEGSEMVFCDNRVYYIPTSVNNPLKPGSIAFNQIAGDGCYPVQPRLAGTAVVFIAAGGLRVSAIIAIGQTNRPYDIANLSELSSHLLNAPVAIAVPSADGTFSERYAYVLNSDGTLAVGKYTLDENSSLKGAVGWVPWSGAGAVKWVSALEADAIFTTSYAPNGIPAVSVVEQLDDTVYLDCAMFANAIPSALTPPGGKGPFWWIAGGSVELMDQGYRPMGTYQIDANGFTVAQFVGGEDLAAATLVGGQMWSATWEPFIPHAPPGQDAQQRMRRRRIVKVNVNVQQSSGFAYGTRRVPAYVQDDDATRPPPLRESSFQFRPRGRSYDPRVQLVKDTPGPLIITEIGIEATA